mgnify:CR=1 FL=1
MKFGLSMFPTDYAIPVTELGRAAEDLGFESLFFPEHTHIPTSRISPWPGGPNLPREYSHTLDPFVAMAAVAAVTTTLKLGTGITLVAQRDPLWLAKEVATIDRISNGRFLFGVGAGWNREEMENHGTPYDKRWKVLEERVKAMKALWTQEEASYHGDWVNFDKVWSYPKPVQRPHPPVILGTFGSNWGRKRVAEFGDGWIPIDLFHGDLKADIDDLHKRLRDNGRDPSEVPISMFDIFETKEDDLKRFADLGLIERAIPRCPTEDRDTVLRWLDRYAEIGRRIGAM